MKKITALVLAMLTLLSICFVTALADTFTNKPIKPGTMTEFDIKAGDTYEYKFTPTVSSAGEYTFLSFGDVRPEVSVSYVKTGILKDETVTDTLAVDNGMVFATYEFTALREYTIRVKAAEGEGKLSLIYFKPNPEKCGFEGELVKTAYCDKAEVSINGTKAEFLNDCLDLTGVTFNLVDDAGTTIYTLSGNNIKKILKSITYENGKIRLAVNASKTFLFWTTAEYSSVSVDVLPYPISGWRLNHDALSYKYGTDGTIKGTLKEHWFIPDIQFDRMTADVTLNDEAGTVLESVPISKENGRYFINVENVGRIYIDNTAKCSESGEQEAEIKIGPDSYKLTVTIEKAGFFQKIGIWFKLLFGVYNK